MKEGKLAQQREKRGEFWQSERIGSKRGDMNYEEVTRCRGIATKEVVV